MTYLDNAATTFPKPKGVLADLNFCLKRYCGNSGRSSHALALKTSEKIYETREEIAKLVGISSPERVVFTYNATYALNIAIKSLIKEKCHIITSDFEHNSVIRPLEKLRLELGVKYSTIDTRGDLSAGLKAAIRPDTRGMVCSIASNVTGDSLPLSVLSDFAKENGLFLIIDGSQAAGHMEIDLNKTPCDAFCAPGHKALFGIQGSGFICFRDKFRRKSFIEGGSGSDSMDVEMPILLPEGYEAGTLSAPAIVALGGGVRFIREVGIHSIEEKLDHLTSATEERLRSIPGITLYKKGCGILSFNYKDLPSSVISSELDSLGICTRGGLHCAPSIHKRLGTLDRGAVRISFSYLNKLRDIDRLYKAMRDIEKKI